MKNEEEQTILLVEDEVLIAMAERMMLEKNGFRVIIASSGEKALEAIAATPEIDLVLMDIDLGAGMSGTDAAKRILSHRDIPLAFLSSHTESEIVEKTEGITSYGYIVKNSGQTVLLASIRMAFRLHKANRARNESESRTRALLDANPDLMLLFDEHSRIIDYHAGDTSLFLVPPERFLNRRVREVVPEELAVLTEDSIARVLERGDPVVAEYQASHSGEQRHYESRFARCGARNVLMISRDITERKKAEQKLRLHALVLDQIQDMVTVTDLEGTIAYVNQANQRFLGFEAGDLIGRPLSVLGDDANRGATQEEILRETRHNGSWRGTVINVARDGSCHVLDCRTQLVNDEHGLPVALCGVSTDITEFTRINEALQRSEERYRAIFDHLPLGLCYYDADGICLECNQAMAVIAGIDRSALIGFDMKTQTDQTALSILERALAGEEVQFEGAIRFGAFPEPKWIKSHQVPLFSPPGEMHVIGIVEDYTVRHQLEEDLRRSRERLQMISENVLDTVSIIDPDGTVLYVTESHRQLGYVPEDLVGAHVFSLLHPEDRDDAESAFHEGANGCGPITKTYRVRRADGKYTPVESRGQIVCDENGVPRYGVISGRLVPETHEEIT
ncbi:MAG: PAS domain S-box protein [Spirochaetaceae bacterium]|nr:MAG: PAS domain S-box protein [Spirochaetaceae bacterium]